MPQKDFDAVRRAYARDEDADPITFTYGGETFTVVREPMFGDTLDLADAPEIDPTAWDPDNPSDLAAVRSLLRFVRAMVEPDDRARFDRAQYRVPAREAFVILDIATWIVEEVTGNPTEPSAIS